MNTQPHPSARGGRAARRANRLEAEADFQKSRGVMSNEDMRGEIAWAEGINCPICRMRVHPTNWSDHMDIYHEDNPTPIHEAEPGRLPLHSIRLDGGTQPRAMTETEVVNDYAESMREGVQFPAVIVFYDGQHYWLADGFHRFSAAQQAGLTDINADVRQGTQRDAILYSVGANANHGLRRTNADKQRAVLRLLGDAEWAAWSNREIARKCAVSESLVRSLREKRSDDNQIRTFTTKHGTTATMNTGNIGKPLSNNPPNSLLDKLGGVGATVQARNKQIGTLVSVNGRDAIVDTPNGRKTWDALYVRKVAESNVDQTDNEPETETNTLYSVTPSDDPNVERARQIALGAVGNSKRDVEWNCKGHGHSFNHDYSIQWGGQLMFILAGKNHSDEKSFARNQVAITILIEGFERLFRFNAFKLLEWKLANTPPQVTHSFQVGQIVRHKQLGSTRKIVTIDGDVLKVEPENPIEAGLTPISDWNAKDVELVERRDPIDYDAYNGGLADAALNSLAENEASGNYKRDSKTTRSADETKSQPFDSCQTPAYALDPLIPHIELFQTIWEPAAGEGLLVEALYDIGWLEEHVVASDVITGENFFEFEPEHAWDCIVTNPPFSLKFDWLRRCYELGKPFALLLPVETLGTKTAQDMFREYGVEIILMDKRVNFKMPNKGWDGAGAQFPVAWFTWGLNIGSQITFARLNNNDDPE